MGHMERRKTLLWILNWGCNSFVMRTLKCGNCGNVMTLEMIQSDINRFVNVLNYEMSQVTMMIMMRVCM